MKALLTILILITLFIIMIVLVMLVKYKEEIWEEIMRRLK